MTHRRRAIIYVILAASLAFFLAHSALAGTLDTTPDCGWSLLGHLGECINYFAIWAVSSIMSLFVSLGAWMVKLALDFNKGITDAPIVQNGFRATLAVVNLGFVLAILVIAIATILDIERYGIKQLLWKLIVAALLVNFSLVIASTIVNAADQFTWFFVTRIAGGKGTTGMVNSMASVMHANSMFSVANRGVVGGFGQILVNIVFVAIFMFTIGFTFMALAILLFIRYLYLVFLYILMPLAWFCWIIPDLNQHWHKWWEYFLRWTFFAPLTLLFLYIAIVGVTGTPDVPAGQKGSGQEYLTNIIGSSTLSNDIVDPRLAAQKTLGDPSLLTNFMGALVAIVFMWGGFMVANSMAIKSAQATLAQAKSLKNSAEGYVKGGKRLVGRLGGNAAYNAYQRGMMKRRGSAEYRDKTYQLQQATGLTGYYKRWRGRKRQEKIIKGEALLEGAKERYKGKTMDQKKAELASMNQAEQIQTILEFQKEGRLLELKNLPEILAKIGKEGFERYGKEKEFKEIKGQSTISLQENVKILSDRSASDDDKKKAGEAVQSYFRSGVDPATVSELFQTIDDPKDEREIRKKLPPGIYDASISAEENYNKLLAMQQVFVKGMLENSSPANLSSVVSKLDRADRQINLQEAAKRLKDAGELDVDKINERVARWMVSSQARGSVGDVHSLFALSAADKDKLSAKYSRKKKSTPPPSGGGGPTIVTPPSGFGGASRSSTTFP